ncbi:MULTISPECIES: alanine racemase [Francisella]|uniref:Alanine racemase n=1 Tax=Francisella opportunistica TaxID=2016517 RepID=A0A345JS22_9GAMM|nr:MULTISPECIES: alanine racemase [Francisella]APC91877.1 Alanine racemase [Francisella sp. MA067296]AXH30118.1 alanine racemase [Francisella opportunistica]AXH31761.1 alanine racemase [Francisella opportunistica]AXH33408.1 alanine racemase [Francisella opportunistica]
MNILEINVQTLRNNIKVIKEYVGNVKFCFPVKANAYGHGLELVVKHSHDLVDFFAVANVFEAFKVLDVVEKPVMIFGVIEYNYIDRILNKNIRVSIQDYSDIEKLEKFANYYNKKPFVHVSLNTGINRMGVDYKDACRTIQRAYESDFLILEGVYSHLACADNRDHPTNIKQKNRFDNIVEYTKGLSQDIICHLSNSYGFVGQKGICYDMVRPGILSYGFLPEFYVDRSIREIKPIARLLSEVVKIITLQEGEGVGYSLIYRGFEGEQLAVVPIGYGDGFPRELGDRGFVNINNVMYPMAGRMSMDGLTVSLGVNEYDVKVGDTVELISDIPRNRNSAFSIAKQTNTIEYDIMSTLNDRVIRKVI